MGTESKIQVSVAYATPEAQVELPVTLNAGTTVAWAIKYSKILERFPEIPFPNIRVGIYGKKVKLDTVLRDGDRVEIYRPLLLDPKQARRERI